MILRCRPPTRRLAFFGFLAVLALAFGLRFFGLTERPMHSDEAVQAYRVGTMLAGETFVYDPQDFHGPTLYYFAFWLSRIFGIESFAGLSEALLRAVPALVGAFSCLGIPLCFFGLRRPGAVLIAGTLLALSPITIFYNDYFIQESLLVAFAWMSAGLIFTRAKTLGNALLAGTLAGLAIASKETWTLMLLAFVCSAGAAWALRFCFKRENNVDALAPDNTSQLVRYVAALLLCTGIVAALFYSSFGGNPHGLIDFFIAFKNYFFSGFNADTPHHAEQSLYYIDLLLGEELLGILIALSVAVTFFRRALFPLPKEKQFGLPFSHPDFRLPFFVAGASCALLILYSLLPYKTPWLALGIVPGIYLFVAAAIDSRILKTVHLRSRLHSVLLFSLLLITLLLALLRPHPPLRYVHTSNELPRITQVVESAKRDFIAGGGKSENFFVAIASQEYWPIPWYLRRERVGCWKNPQSVPEGAPLIIADPESWSDSTWGTKKFRTVFCAELRPGVIVEARVFFETRN